jgi:hypothetical protein
MTTRQVGIAQSARFVTDVEPGLLRAASPAGIAVSVRRNPDCREWSPRYCDAHIAIPAYDDSQ